MDTRTLLLTVVIFAHCLIAGMWWIAGTWMGLSRRASRHWMTAALAYGAALSITAMGQTTATQAHDLTTAALGTTLLVWGAISHRRGLSFFLKTPVSRLEQTLLISGVSALNLLLCWPLGAITAAMAISGLTLNWTLWRTVRQAYQPIVVEFNRGTARSYAFLLALAASVFALAFLGDAFPAIGQLAGDSPLARQQHIVLLSVAISVLSAFVLGYMVVMRLVRRLEHLSHHDALTGLLNRRAIEYLLDREDQRLQRFADPYCVMLLDIDHFKRINDRLGHAAGDAVLCAVAKTLQQQGREVDRVSRYGGEEFCVLLPHTQHDGAAQAAERLRDAVSRTSVPWNDEVISVTISVGLACADAPGEPLPALLARADEALYRAKAEGRNRVVASSAPPRHTRSA